MSVIPDPPPAPAELRLDADDVVESFEVVAHGSGPDEDAVLAEVDAEAAWEGETHPDDATDEGEAEPVERTSGFDGIGTRREARERALALLYEAEQKGCDPLGDVLVGLPVRPEPFAVELVEGVSEHRSELDDLIGAVSVGWTVVRMPAIDRNLLRIGAFELAHTDVPVGACISEAVELAKRYSTDDSHTFVNGVLGRLAHDLRGPA